MPRVKALNYVLQYGDTGYFINDLGEGKSQRFELYHEPTKKTVMKTNNPYDCTEWIKKNIWKEEYNNEPL